MSKLKFSENIKLVVTDFDGVITDNCVYIDENQKMTRRLNFRDVMAFSLLKKNGIITAIISGEKNSAIDLIREKFDIEDIHTEIRQKKPVLKDLLKKYNINETEFIYVGDDVNDRECLEFAKYKVTVKNAHKSILEIKNIQITENNGGEGAFREIVDALLEQKTIS